MDERRVAKLVVLGVVGIVAAMVLTSAAYGLGDRYRPVDTSVLSADERALLVEQAKSAVEVEASACGGSTTGTGFVIDGTLITAHHLTDGGDSVGLRALDGGRGWTSVVGSSPRLDLAAGAVGPGLDGLGLRLATENVSSGEPVVAVGWVDGELRWQEGAVRYVGDGRAYGLAGDVVLVEPGGGPGFSGGPVFNRHGEVVAVVSAVDLTTDLGVAVAASEVAAWLSSALIEGHATSCIEQ